MASRYSRVDIAPSEDHRIAQQIVAVTRTATRRRGQKSREARLNQISIYGCRLLIGEEHRANERLWLHIGGCAPVAATVIWSDGAAAGCRFDEPIPGSLVRAVTLAAG